MYTDIAHRKSLDFRDNFDRTVLHYAVRLNNLQETRNLLREGANVNVIDAFGSTPLSMACVDWPSIQMVNLLLQYNADVNLERNSCMDLLLECGLNCTTPQHVTIIKILIKHGKNINLTDDLTNRSIMHIIALTGYIPLIEELLKLGAIVNIKDNSNCTPLTIAAAHGNLKVLNLLRDCNRLI